MARPITLAILCTFTLMGSLTTMSTATDAKAVADDEAQAFIAEHEKTVRPLERDAALAWWNANISGKDEDFEAKEESQNRLDAALADRDRFARLKAIKEGPIGDPLARPSGRRALPGLPREAGRSRRCSSKITAKANAIEKAFNVYRAKVDGEEMTDSEVRKVLKESKDSAERKAVWEASKAVGPVVEADLKALVKLRNEAAHEAGVPQLPRACSSISTSRTRSRSSSSSTNSTR